jgi:hypothetical protein
VIDVSCSGNPLEITLGIRLLQSTLEQMYDSVMFQDEAIKGLFVKGKEIGRILREDFNAVYVESTGRRRDKEEK